jgi:peptidoglycan-N-acetylglucosamine deacetylase
MRSFISLILLLLLGAVPGLAAECPGNPNAIGTSRVIAVDPAQYPRVGTWQYSQTLPLEDHEVVLTFDDGPLPPRTAKVLDILAANCVKATFFIVGRMAKNFPGLVRRAAMEGHTIGTHTEDHPMNMPKLPLGQSEKEIQDGIASTTKALGGSAALAPFFRLPGFARSEAIENYAASSGLMIWSTDVIAGDWKPISPEEVTERSLDRLIHKGKGILLLHDIHDRTVQALPALLDRLRSAGFRVVHVVPAGRGQSKTVTAPAQ